MSTERGKHYRERVRQWPLREVGEIRRRLEDDIARPVLRNIWDRISFEMPPIDVLDKADDLVVKIELPGMKYEDIEVSISEDTLVIKGEKKPESGVEDKDYYQSEITYGSFHRSLALTPGIDTENIEAIYENGVLRITLKRVQEAKPQKIEVKVKKEEA